MDIASSQTWTVDNYPMPPMRRSILNYATPMPPGQTGQPASGYGFVLLSLLAAVGSFFGLVFVASHRFLALDDPRLARRLIFTCALVGVALCLGAAMALINIRRGEQTMLSWIGLSICGFLLPFALGMLYLILH
jgi:hypothetical protein